MKEIKKYTDIVRYGKPNTKDVIKEGDIISITEKLDGANASFTLDIENLNGVSCYSRKLALNEENTLRGFYGWVQENIVPIKDQLNPNYRYIGEWLVSHKIQYKEDSYYNFYMFSIWDDEKEEYLSDDIVISEAKRLGLKTVEYFYVGEFISYEHMSSFIGKSNLTKEPDTGEGIVVKNVNYKDSYGKQCFVKLVSERFAEIQKQRPPKNPNIDSKTDATIKSVLTKPRVEKLMYKLVDEELITKEDFALESMGTLLKLLGSRVLEDMLKEEFEILKDIEEKTLKRRVGSILPLVIKEILKEY